MTVTVPTNDKSNALKLQSEITTLGARSDSFSQQLLAQRQVDLVNTLLDQGKLNAATILAGYTGSRNPLAAQIANYQSIVNGGTGAAAAARGVLAQLQSQAVAELMANGALTAATILANQSYIGAAPR